MENYFAKAVKFTIDTATDIAKLAWPWFWRAAGATMGVVSVLLLIGGDA